MKRFVVDPDAFYAMEGELAAAAFARYSGPEVRERCRVPMQQLIDHYELAGRRVLSIGANGGHEEYWLHRAGCELTFVDLDEAGTLEPYLESLPSASSAGLSYVVGDAATYVATSDDTFDCVYVSSYTPDELRRDRVQAEYRPWYHRPLNGRAPLARTLVVMVNGLVRRATGRRPIRLRTWPAGTAPFCGELIRAVRDHLEPGGVFFNQSYAGVVDIPDNPHFVELMREQLASVGAQLLAVYHFAPGWTDVSLTVAYKGTPSEAGAFSERIRQTPDIRDFHGRSDAPRSIRRAPGTPG